MKRQKSATAKRRAGMGEQADGVERGKGQRGVEEQPRHVGAVLDREPAAQTPPQHDDPEDQAER